MPTRPLTREKIYETALRILEKEGVEALTARKLAATLKCSLSTLYTLAGKREALVAGLLEYYFLTCPISVSESGDWKQQTAEWAEAVRDVITGHPNLARLLMTKHRTVHAYFAAELFRILRQAGFSDQEAFDSARVLTVQVVNFAREQVNAPTPEEMRQLPPEDEMSENERFLRNIDVEFEDLDQLFARSVRYTINGIACER